MRKYLFLLCSLAVLLPACKPEQMPADEEPYVSDVVGDEIGTYFDEGRQMTFRLLDITELYEEVAYNTWAVPVNHVRYDNLPAGLKETVKSYGLSSSTQVYSMQWKGETCYHLISLIMMDWDGVYRPTGENVYFATQDAYLEFLQESEDVTCILLTDVDVVRSASGAPRLLPGTWQMDWLHLHHDVNLGSGIDDQVALYPDLPFSITEVCHFDTDGTGYFRSVKSFKDGSEEVALDPFDYRLVDYHTQDNLQDYTFVCYFEAGDTIQYTARSLDGFKGNFDRSFGFVTYPWYKKGSDAFAGKTGGPKYGVPEKDARMPIVGRWTGTAKSAALVFGIKHYTWVFRADGTGYLLISKQHQYSFAYTVEGEDPSALQLTIYKYDTMFYTTDGFWQEGDRSYRFTPTPVPTGEPLKAKISADGNSLELEGWANRGADYYSKTPIVFTRVR